MIPGVGTDGWTRRRFVGAAAAFAGGACLPLARITRAAAAVAPAAAGAARAFRSRPDLMPPAVTITVPAEGTEPGLLFLAPFTGPGQYGPLLVDDAGEPVWFLPVNGRTAMNFRLQHYRGQPVLTWWEGKVNGGYGGGTGVIVDASYRQIARVRAGNGLQSDLHEFVITSRNTALVAIYNELPADLSTVDGPSDGRAVEGVVQEIDIASGRLLFEWHSLDHVGLDESYRAYPTDPGLFDYFHLNSIGVDLDGHLLVSARHTSTVYKVHRRTGRVLWRLGGKRSDFAVGPGAAFAFQHDARRHGDGTLTVFDNAAWSPAGATEQASRPLRLALDTTAMTATLVHDFAVTAPRLAVAMGNLQLLPDGSALVGWGTAGSFSEIAEDGTLRLDAHFAGGGLSYRALRFPWAGRPGGRPAVAAARQPDGTVSVAVSWNGATAVDRWQVRAGPRAGSLRAVQTAPRTGFETTIELPLPAGVIAVAALDPRGRVLGVSAPLGV